MKNETATEQRAEVVPMCARCGGERDSAVCDTCGANGVEK